MHLDAVDAFGRTTLSTQADLCELAAFVPSDKLLRKFKRLRSVHLPGTTDWPETGSLQESSRESVFEGTSPAQWLHEAIADTAISVSTRYVQDTEALGFELDANAEAQFRGEFERRLPFKPGAVRAQFTSLVLSELKQQLCTVGPLVLDKAFLSCPDGRTLMLMPRGPDDTKASMAVSPSPMVRARGVALFMSEAMCRTKAMAGAAPRATKRGVGAADVCQDDVPTEPASGS